MRLHVLAATPEPDHHFVLAQATQVPEVDSWYPLEHVAALFVAAHVAAFVAHVLPVAGPLMQELAGTAVSVQK